jgi:hypothetical protein
MNRQNFLLSNEHRRWATTQWPAGKPCSCSSNPPLPHATRAVGTPDLMQEASPIYHTRIQKGGALLDDMRLLVRSWADSSSAEETQVARSLLRKKTLARSKDTFIRAFNPRFLHGDPPNAWKLVRCLEDRNADLELLRPLYFWITARGDRLLYDFVTQELINIARSGDGSVRIEETTSWIRAQLKRTHQTWSPTVTLKVARGLLAALRDFKLLEGATRKRVAPVHLPIESFCYVAFCLCLLGCSGEALVHHPDWRLFLLTPSLVERLFLDAHQRNYLSFHSAGRIYRIDFPVASHEAYADVILGTKP